MIQIFVFVVVVVVLYTVRSVSGRCELQIKNLLPVWKRTLDLIAQSHICLLNTIQNIHLLLMAPYNYGLLYIWLDFFKQHHIFFCSFDRSLLLLYSRLDHGLMYHDCFHQAQGGKISCDFPRNVPSGSTNSLSYPLAANFFLSELAPSTVDRLDMAQKCSTSISKLLPS